MKFTNSPLVDYTKISPNKTSPRNHKIDTVTIHCYVGQAQVESMADWLCDPKAKASSNYGIGVDGRIGMFVEEGDRSWCSSSAANDNQAVTIECACDKTAPYAVNDSVYVSLIRLLTDICERNGIKELKWKGDKSLIGKISEQNMTVHMWFKNKSCPGEYLLSRHGDIADKVNARLNGTDVPEAPITDFPKVPFIVDVLIDDLNYRSDPSMDGEVRGHTGKGTFTIVDVTDGWGKLKSCRGWIWLGNPAYCTVDGPAPSEEKPKPKTPYQTRVVVDALNIRKGPGINYAITGATEKGVFTIVEENDSGTWGKLKSGPGWISLAYTKKI